MAQHGASKRQRCRGNAPCRVYAIQQPRVRHAAAASASGISVRAGTLRLYTGEENKADNPRMAAASQQQHIRRLCGDPRAINGSGMATIVTAINAMASRRC